MRGPGVDEACAAHEVVGLVAELLLDLIGLISFFFRNLRCLDELVLAADGCHRATTGHNTFIFFLIFIIGLPEQERRNARKTVGEHEVLPLVLQWVIALGEVPTVTCLQMVDRHVDWTLVEISEQLRVARRAASVPVPALHPVAVDLVLAHSQLHRLVFDGVDDAVARAHHRHEETAVAAVVQVIVSVTLTT